MISIVSAANMVFDDMEIKIFSERNKGRLHDYHDVLIISSMGNYRDDIDYLIEWLGQMPFTACFYGSIEQSASYRNAIKTKRYGGFVQRLAPDVLMLEPFYIYSIPINECSYRNFMFIPGDRHPQPRVKFAKHLLLNSVESSDKYAHVDMKKVLSSIADVDYVVSDCVPANCYGLFSYVFKPDDFSIYLGELQKTAAMKHWIASGYAYDYTLSPWFSNIWHRPYDIVEQIED